MTTRIQLTTRVHLTWTFILTPYSDFSVLLAPLARTSLFYHSLLQKLFSVIKMKDTHISSLQEKLKDLGGSYFPRKGRDLLEGFDVEKWRHEQRSVVREEESSVMGGVGGWWGVGGGGKREWGDVVGGLVQGAREKVYLSGTEVNFRE